MNLLTPPVHQPGVYSKFLTDNGVAVIISGGMRVKAHGLFVYVRYKKLIHKKKKQKVF